MIVTCISFGSYWWTRPGYDPHTGSIQLARTAYFNTTGIKHGRSITPAHEVAGRVRINAWMKPIITSVEDVVGGTFETNPVEVTVVPINSSCAGGQHLRRLTFIFCASAATQMVTLILKDRGDPVM